MKIENFEDIISWQKGRELSFLIHQVLKNNRDYGFKNQIERAAVSVSNNIAEGYERKGSRELKQFLFIAKGSCGEVRSMLYLALDFKYIDQEIFKKSYDLSLEICRLLSGFIKKL